MIIHFAEVEKFDEKLANIKNIKVILEDVYENCPVLWQEFKQLVSEIEKDEVN